MSRFFVNDDSGEDDDEDSVNDEKNPILDDADFNIKIKPMIDSIDNKLSLFFDSINQNSIDPNIQDNIDKLSNDFNELISSTANTSIKLPNPILESLVKIKQKLFSKSSDDNFNQILTKFNNLCSPFASQINTFCENSNSGQVEDGWFVDSDDEDDKSPVQIRLGIKRQKINGVYVYINEKQEETIDNSTIKRELATFSEARINGIIKATTKRLTQLLKATTDTRLVQLINNEIILTVSQTPVDQPIENNDWIFSLDALSNTSLNPNDLYSLFRRLNDDYWARTIDIRYLFIPSTAQLHELTPRFISQLNDYLNIVKVEEYPEAYIRTADILIEHLYGDENEQQNVIRLTANILKYLSTANLNNFTRIQFGLSSFSHDGENIRNRASLFLSYNLSISNHPIEAFEIFRCIPLISGDFGHTRILYNRVRAQIGLFAFKNGLFKLSYDMLRHFINTKMISKNIGQEPNSIFPAWMMIDHESIAHLLYISALLIDLPHLALNEATVDKNLLRIHLKMHRDLLKEPIAHPEIHLEKAISAVSFAKEGDWKQAFEAFREDLDEEYHGVFIDALKRDSLCAFLLNAGNYYESISFDFLSQMFELPESEIRATIDIMNQQKSPIDHIPIVFKPAKIVDDKFLVF